MELSKTFDYQGWSIRYAILEPESPTPSKELIDVVFIHGTPWSSVVFVPLVKSLLAKGRYRVLLYDLPGYGRSQKYSTTASAARSNGLFEGDTSIGFQGAALAALLESLRLDGRGAAAKPAVIAHDIAGAIALRALLVHGCDFGSLMFWDTNTVLPWGDGFYKLARAEAQVFLQMPTHILEAVIRAVIRSGCCDSGKLTLEWENALAAPWTSADDGADLTVQDRQKNFIRQIAQTDDQHIAEMLDQNLYSKVQCPVKIMWGEQDTWIPKDKMEQLAEMLKHCLKEFVIVPEAGHLLMLDQPERVTSEVFEWLEKQ